MDNKPQVQVLSTFSHVECTNFVAKSTVGVLSLRVLQDALVETLDRINVDIVEFVACNLLVGHSIPDIPLLLPLFKLPDRVNFMAHFDLPDRLNFIAHLEAFCQDEEHMHAGSILVIFPLEPPFKYCAALLFCCASSTAVWVFLPPRKPVYQLPCEGVQASYKVFRAIARYWGVCSSKHRRRFSGGIAAAAGWPSLLLEPIPWYDFEFHDGKATSYNVKKQVP